MTDDQDANVELNPGDRVSHYEIVGELGRGGMGIVYRASDLELSRQVALKHSGPKLADDPAARQRFKREGRAAAGLLHPHVVAVLDMTTTVARSSRTSGSRVSSRLRGR